MSNDIVNDIIHFMYIIIGLVEYKYEIQYFIGL